MNLKNSVLSFSSLTRFADSPLAFIDYKMAPKEPTPAMVLGTLVHRKVLEPEEYAKTVHVWNGRRAGAAWKEFAEEHRSGSIITVSESEKIEAIALSVASHREASRLLEACDDFEMEIRWKHMGTLHRGFVDARGPGYIVDLKVTVNTTPKDLQRMIWDRQYYMQAAMYMHGLVQNGYDVDEAYIICVQSQRPYSVRPVRLPSHYIVRGHHEWERLLRMWDAWDGLPAHDHDGGGIIDIDAPAWAPIPNGMRGDKQAR